jgi:hypothetical protein
LHLASASLSGFVTSAPKRIGNRRALPNRARPSSYREELERRWLEKSGELITENWTNRGAAAIVRANHRP